jgi:hypothetical protein
VNREEFERQLGRPMLDRAGFVQAVTDAAAAGSPYAAGKIGHTEQALLHYPLVMERETDPRRIRAFEVSVVSRASRLGGVFPADREFVGEFSLRLASDLRKLDCLGLFDPMWASELELLRGHRYEGEVVHYLDQEPDRGIPADDRLCYLPAFRDRRILLVCASAELLRDRANGETYEAVWSKIGKRWFEPASVEALPIPYSYDPDSVGSNETALDRLEEISQSIASKEFDVALIAAGSLGIPIAAAVKRLGRIGISLGGHLQVLFGVHGERWLAQPDWHRDYFNDAWIRMPPEYVPEAQAPEVNYW